MKKKILVIVMLLISLLNLAGTWVIAADLRDWFETRNVGSESKEYQGAFVDDWTQRY